MSITTRLSRRQSSRIATTTATIAIIAITTTIPTITNAQDSDSDTPTYGMDRGDYSNIFQSSNTVIMNNSNCRYTTSIQTMTCMGVRCQNSHSGGCSNEELLVESSQNNCSDNGEEQPIVCEYDVLCCPISSMMEEDNDERDTIDGIGSNWVGIGNNNNNDNDGWSDSPQMYTGQVEYTPSIRTSGDDSGGNGIGAGIGFAFVFGIGLAIFIAITRIKQRSGDQIGHNNIGGGAALALQSGGGGDSGTNKRQKKKKKQPNNSNNSRSIYDIDDDSEDYSELSTGSRRSSTLSKEGSGGNSRSSKSSRNGNSNNYHHHHNKRVPRDPSLDPFEIGGAGE